MIKFHDFLDQLRNALIPTMCKLGSHDEQDGNDILIETQKIASRAICFYVEAVPKLEVVPELFRLPYPVCWFEIRDQLTLPDGGIPEEFADLANSFDLQRAARNARHGVLAYSKDDGIQLTCFSENFSGRWVLLAEATLRIDQSAGETGINASFWERDDGFAGPDGIALPSGADSRVGLDYLRQVGCVLTAMNCVNIERVEHHPPTKLQAARARRGRQPLFSYWTLNLADSNRSCGNSGGSHASPRLHLRRGHPRRLASGSYCWVQPHVVGNKSLGMVHKDYSMAAKSSASLRDDIASQ